MVGGNSGSATAVDASPVVEQLIVLLERHYVSPEKGWEDNLKMTENPDQLLFMTIIIIITSL
jgi:hypothetical protein